MNLSKKICCIAISALMIFTGCGKKGEEVSTEKKEKNVAMGRYVEKPLDLPINYDEESLISFVKNTEGKLVAFIGIGKDGTGVDEIAKYTLQEDNSWTREKEEALTNLYAGHDSLYSASIKYGEDGNIYATYIDTDDGYKPHIFKSTDGINYEEVMLEGWDKKNTDTGFYPFIDTFDVAKNGNILISYSRNSEIFDGTTGRILAKIDSQESQIASTAVRGNRAVIAKSDMSGVMICDMVSGNILSEIPVDSVDNYSFTSFYMDEEETIYMANKDGISRVSSGGSLWEIIVDGKLTSMSMPTLYNGCLVNGNNNDYYVMFGNDENKNTLMHYTYSKEIPSVPDKEISVYSLNELSTIRQAVVEFQRNNPDVFINYRVAMGNEGATTVSDNIRALNTELLAGKGSDIIILDGLPIDSYIEKGVLADMSDIIEPMIEKGDLLTNIIDNYNQDGKYYSIPLRYKLPVVLGKTDVLNVVGTMDDLADYADKNTVPVLPPMTNKGLIQLFFELNSNLLLEEAGELNQDQFAKFLNNIKSISNSIKILDDSERVGVDLSSMDFFRIASGESLVSIQKIGGLQDAMFPVSIADQIGGEIRTVNDIFIPTGIIGINNAGKQQDLAKEFVTLLLSEDIQKVDLYEGFPVNSQALEGWNDVVRSVSAAASITSETGEESMISAEWPTEEQRKMLTGLCKTLTTPSKNDDVLLEMILNETEAFTNGEKSAEQTAQIVSERAKAYLSE